MGRPAPAVALTVVLSDDQLDELARRVAREILAASPCDTYDQTDPPPGMTPRSYLTAARAGKFMTRKVGRKVVAARADVDAWRATLPSARTEAGSKGAVASAAKADNDVEAHAEALDPDVARLVEMNNKPRG